MAAHAPAQAAKEMGRAELAKRLAEIDLSQAIGPPLRVASEA